MRVAEASFIQFVYPFLFEATEFDARCQAIDSAQWLGREGKPLPVWETDYFSTEDVLPHIVGYLNPQQEKPATARLWRVVSDGALISLRGVGAQAEWGLCFPQGEIAFQMDGIKLSLFCVGVGFVVVCAKPTTDAVDDWLDFTHHFRFSDSQRPVRVRARQRTGRDESTPFFPRQAGGVEAHPNGEGNFGEILDMLLRTAQGAAKQQIWWRDVFVPGRMLPFVTLYLDGAAPEEQPRLLYRARKFFHARQEIHPSTVDLSPTHPALLPYAQDQWLTFSLDGGAFVAFDAPTR